MEEKQCRTLAADTAATAVVGNERTGWRVTPPLASSRALSLVLVL